MQSGWLYETFLRRDGRLNRLRFFKRVMLAAIVPIIAVLILTMGISAGIAGIFAAANEGIIPIPSGTGGTGVAVGSMVCIAVSFLVPLYLCYGLIIRRCHDLMHDSFLYPYISRDDTIVAKIIIIGTLLSFIPLIGIIVFLLELYLLFVPGEIGANEFGEDPLAK